MAEPFRNGEPWRRHEDAALITMVEEGLTYREVAERIGRTKRAVNARMIELAKAGIKPTRRCRWCDVLLKGRERDFCCAEHCTRWHSRERSEMKKLERQRKRGPRFCKNCDAPIPEETDHRVRYCNDTCKRRYEADQKRISRGRPVGSPRVCAECTAPLPEGVSARQRFCSKSCRKRQSNRFYMRGRRARDRAARDG